MQDRWPWTPRRAALKTVAAVPGALALLGVGAYAVYAEVGPSEPPGPVAPSIIAKPATLTTQTRARFRFTDSDQQVKFQCSLDRSRFRGCPSPKLYHGPLAAGRHTFRVRAIRSSNSLEPSRATSYTWSVERAPAAPHIIRHPANPTTSTSATFLFLDGEPRVRFRCRLDSAAWRSCADRVTYRGMGVGLHQLLVRAVTRSARPSPLTRFRWRITPAVGMRFTITSGALPGLLYPGAAALSIPVTLTNPNSVPIFVSNVTVAVAGGPPGCDSASNLSLSQSNASAANEVEVPAEGSVTLPAQDVSPPTIGLRNLPVNQDACINAAFPLSFTGSAHS